MDEMGGAVLEPSAEKVPEKMNFDVIKRDEVRMMYEQAADKRMQIRIMSELMSCEEADICDLLGIPATRKRKRHQINEEKALKMHRRGASDREIAEEFGVTKDAVKAWKWRTGLMEQSEETKAKYAQCMEFYEQGMTDGEIALATGMKRKAVCDWRKQNKLPPQKRPHREWGKDDERFMPLYESGMNDAQIADVFGLNYWNVRSWRHRRGLKANKSNPKPVKEDGKFAIGVISSTYREQEGKEMNVYTTTIILENEQRIDNVKWHKCLSDAVERYRQQTGQDVRSVQFGVKGVEQ